MIGRGRPRKPSHKAIQEVLNAISICSCGGFEKQFPPSDKVRPLTKEIMEKMFHCKCVGPKSPSQLIRITRLHPNTLYKTCKFLVKQGVLTRTVLKMKGHHVEYSIDDRYWNNASLRMEIELSANERKKFFADTIEILKAGSSFMKQYKKVHRYYRKAIETLRTRYPEAEWLPVVQYWYLVKLVHILGEEEGLARFLDEREHLRPLGELAFTRLARKEVFGSRMQTDE